MKQIKNFVMALLGILMCFCLCGCPIQGEDEDYKVIAKMNNDYSKNAYVDLRDSVKQLHYSENAIKIVEIPYYEVKFGEGLLENVAITSFIGDSIKGKKIYLDSEEKLIDKDPFKEIYYYEGNYVDLKKIINKKELSKLKKIK